MKMRKIIPALALAATGLVAPAALSAQLFECITTTITTTRTITFSDGTSATYIHSETVRTCRPLQT